jgi:hypothetical protein
MKKSAISNLQRNSKLFATAVRQAKELRQAHVTNDFLTREAEIFRTENEKLQTENEQLKVDIADQEKLFLNERLGLERSINERARIIVAEQTQSTEKLDTLIKETRLELDDVRDYNRTLLHQRDLLLQIVMDALTG